MTTRIILIRHGESTANVAASIAEATGRETIPVECRDADVPLSALGEQQAATLSERLREELDGNIADASIWCSPYRRARRTAQLALGEDAFFAIDERLRDRELGVLDTLTAAGVERRLPEEAARRRWLGKFYYRPPGGEAWTDVALRIRSFVADVAAANSLPLVVFAHDAVVSLFLYVLSGWTEQQLDEFLLTRIVGNASLTVLVGNGHRWNIETFADESHLARAGVPSTSHPGAARVTE